MKNSKFISVILILTFSISICANILTGCQRGNDEFCTVMRFSVASDVHIEDDERSAVEEARLKKLFELAYAHAESTPDGYHNLDAALFVGDFTNYGTTPSMQKFKKIAEENKREETKLVVSLGNHEFYADGETAEERYKQVFSTELDEHFTICGFHFIKLSASGEYFSEEKLSWLRRELESASKASPRRPIFVMQHQHPRGTVYGSGAWGDDKIYEVLSDFPQVVDFSGHSHFPIIDERSLWQGEFTAIGTGTLSYAELGLNGVADEFLFPIGNEGDYEYMERSGARDYGVFQIVEVAKSGALRITGYDIDSGSRLFVRSVENPSNKLSFKTNEEKANDTPIPVFKEGSAARAVTEEDGSVTVIVPQAISEASIESYRAEIYDGDIKINTCYALSGYIHTPMPSEIKIRLGMMESGKIYTVKIFAVNAYGRSSKQPLTLEITK